MARFLSLPRPERGDLIAAPISAFESETQAVMQRTAPYSEHVVVHILAGMIVLALVLMSVVKLDRVVNSTGRILPSQGSLFVQPLDRAIVTNIQAHAGDVVKRGQVLATLDPTFAQADLTNLEQKKNSLEALVGRLKAEQSGRRFEANPASPYSVLQASIWAQRQAEYQQSLNDLDAKMRSAGSVVQRSRQDALDYQQRYELASQAERAHVQLQAQGFGSKLSLLSATDARVEMQRLASENQNQTNQAQHDLASLSAQRAEYIGKWRDDIATQLVTAQNDLNEATQSLAKASRVSDLSTLTAPADAVVLKVANASIGSVIDPSSSAVAPLFTLTPLGGPLDAEVHVAARDIGFIRPGDTVRIKLDAYNFTRHGTLKGVIKSVSQGSFTTSDDGQVISPYYKVIVRITEVHLRNVPASFTLIPGLTVNGEVMVGRRTIMSYLLEGALRTGSEAMREPS